MREVIGSEHLFDIPHHEPGTGVGTGLMIPVVFLRTAKVGYAFHQHAVLLQHVSGKIEAVAFFAPNAQECVSGLSLSIPNGSSTIKNQCP